MTILNSAVVSTFAAFMILGGMVNYAIWCRLRGVFLRQDLFAVRDALWDQAQKGGFLADARYIATRRQINGLIRSASLLSIEILRLPVPSKDRIKLPNAGSRHIEQLCDAALSDCGRIVWVYVLFHRASGWLYVAGALLRGVMAATKRKTLELAKSWARSTLPEQAYILEQNAAVAR